MANYFSNGLLSNVSEQRNPTPNSSSHLKGYDTRDILGSCKYQRPDQPGSGSSCGCQRYFLSSAAAEEEWCVCGHHSCFHALHTCRSTGLGLTTGHQLYTANSYVQNSDHLDAQSRAQHPSLAPSSSSHNDLVVPTTFCTTMPPISAGPKSVSATQNPLTNNPNANSHLGLVALDDASRKAEMQYVSSNINHHSSFSSVGLPHETDIVAGLSARPVQSLSHGLGTEDLLNREGDDMIGSATEVVTPSLRNTPTLEQFESFEKAIHGIRSAFQELKRDLDRSNIAQKSFRDGNPAIKLMDSLHEETTAPKGLTVQFLVHAVDRFARASEKIISKQLEEQPASALVKDLITRIEILETASFSLSGVDDWSERLEVFDWRITDLETNLTDILRSRSLEEERESLVERPGTRISKDAHPLSSFSLSLTSAEAENALRSRIRNQLSALESRVYDMEMTAPPSSKHPWEVDVILLPWGRELRGLWSSQHCAPHSKHAELLNFPPPDFQMISQQNNAKSANASIHQSIWNSQSIRKWSEDTGERMTARACGTSSKVFQRLSSKGFVKRIQLRGAGAKDIQQAIETAFSCSLHMLCSRQRLRSKDQPSLQPTSNQLLGLSSSFIPLRKQHKNSNLQHLHQAELISPSLWDSTYLQANVLMNPFKDSKSLFITTSDGYEQPSEMTSGWTWNMIKALPDSDESLRISSDGVSQDYSVRLEDCWEWDSRLDGGSIASSIPEKQHQSASDPASVQLTTQFEDEVSTSAVHHHSPLPRRIDRGQMIEPISPQSGQISDHHSRDCTQAEHQRRKRSEPMDTNKPIEPKSPKRARLSSPASMDCPLSPFFEEDKDVVPTSSSTSASNRGYFPGTPTAYATPYSGTNVLPLLPKTESGSSCFDSDGFVAPQSGQSIDCSTSILGRSDAHGLGGARRNGDDQSITSDNFWEDD